MEAVLGKPRPVKDITSSDDFVLGTPRRATNKWSSDDIVLGTPRKQGEERAPVSSTEPAQAESITLSRMITPPLEGVEPDRPMAGRSVMERYYEEAKSDVSGLEAAYKSYEDKYVDKEALANMPGRKAAIEIARMKSEAKAAFMEDFLSNMNPNDFDSEEEFESTKDVLDTLGFNTLYALTYAGAAGKAATGTVITGLEKAFESIGVDEPRTQARKAMRDIIALTEASSGVLPSGLPSAGEAIRLTVPSLSKIKAPQALKDIAIKTADVIGPSVSKKFNVGSARMAMEEKEKAAKAAARQAAAKYPEITEELIKGFEDNLGMSISKRTEEGKLEIDYDKVRTAGRAVMESDAGLEGDELINPTLDPDTFQSLVAVLGDFNDKYPGAISASKKEPIIQQLSKYIVSEDLDVEKAKYIGQILTNYGMSTEEFLTSLVGSVSDAGRTLKAWQDATRKLTQKGSESELLKEAEVAKKVRENALYRNFRRVENARRGVLTSQIATAVRNAESMLIRTPMEALGNVMDEALYRVGEGKGIKSVGALVEPETWKGSFRGLQYMFDERKNVEDYVKLLEEQPELGPTINDMLYSIADVREAMDGVKDIPAPKSGIAGAVDKGITEIEDFADAITTPNRFIDFVVRRATFYSEIERLVKREYGLDFTQEVNNGNIRKFIDGSIIPEDKRAFTEIVSDASEKALNITYGKQPDWSVFRGISNAITRSGATILVPFPRFMFNSLELIGQYVGGSGIAAYRAIAGKKGMDRVNRESITRNIMGAAAIAGMMQYRDSEDAPEDLVKVALNDKKILDTTPIYPIPQLMYAAEATKRYMDDELGTWFDPEEFIQIFTGSNLRVGSGGDMLQGLADIARDSQAEGASTAKALGEAVGQYLQTWLVPLNQLVKAQRAAGVRTSEAKDISTEPSLEATQEFFRGMGLPMRRSGIATLPSTELELPSREQAVGTTGSKEPQDYMLALFGQNVEPADTDVVEYLLDYGIKPYIAGSRDVSPTVKRAENMLLQEVLPLVVNAAKEYETDLGNKYDSTAPEAPEGKNVYVREHMKAFLKGQIANAKSMVREIGPVGLESMSEDQKNLIISIREFRKIPPDIQRAAFREFKLDKKREPDYTDPKDVLSLKTYGDALKDVYNK